MKRAAFTLQLLAVLVLAPGLTSRAQNNGFVSLEGRQFMVDGQPFYPRVINYEMEFVIDAQLPHDPNDVFVSCSSWYGSGPFWGFNCSNAQDCEADIIEQFDLIAAMGYNTIRIVHFALPFFTVNANNAQKLKLDVRTYPGYVNPYDSPHELVEPTFTDPWSARLFYFTRHIIQLANAHGLKTILLCSDRHISSPVRDLDGVALYSSYLQRLGDELKDEPGLLAYDLWNEPIFSDPSEMMAWTKGEVCTYVAEWYDALHVNDQDHLVTIGGSGFTELPWWDPSLLKLDFYSAHLYPVPDQVNGFDIANATERVIHELYWLGATSVMPFMIGETGFTADDRTNVTNFLDADPAHHAWPYHHGSEIQQAYFMETTMNRTREFLGSGYSWWNFQNTHSLGLDMAPQDPGKFRGGYFGALTFGGDFATDALYKIATAALDTYTPPALPTSLPAPTASYYNQYGFTGAPYRTYAVQDQNQQPIAHAATEVAWRYHLETDPQNVYFDSWNKVPSDASGALVIPQPPDILLYQAPVEAKFTLSATGTGRVEYGGGWPPDGAVFELEREVMLHEKVVDGLDVYSNDSWSDKAWAHLRFTNATVYGNGTTGGTLDAVARTVSAGPGFHAQHGSEVHLRAEKTFADCTNDAYRVMATSPSGSEAFEHKANKGTISLQFSLALVDVSASPNPCADNTLLTLSEAVSSASFTLVDAQGSVVARGSFSGASYLLDTQKLAAGSYRLNISADGQPFSTSLIKLP